jgi:hypothetical protein
MRAFFSLLSIVLVLAIGYYAYTAMFQAMPEGKSIPQEVSLIGVKTDLLSLAQAERFYLAANGAYGTLEQLRAGGSPGSIPEGPRRGYSYELEVEGNAHFRIVARPIEAGSAFPTLSIDETMQIQ